jgi:hypothetical protein
MDRLWTDRDIVALLERTEGEKRAVALKMSH